MSEGRAEKNRKIAMASKKQPHPLRASEIERFERNLANWLKLDPDQLCTTASKVCWKAKS
jgi:hypothetical protein